MFVHQRVSQSMGHALIKIAVTQRVHIRVWSGLHDEAGEMKPRTLVTDLQGCTAEDGVLVS